MLMSYVSLCLVTMDVSAVMVNGDTGTDGLKTIDKCVIESCSG